MPQENKRFWISWWTQKEDPTIVQTDFDFWLGGERGDEPDVYYLLLAVIEAPDEKQAYRRIQKYFPDYEERFCQEVEKERIPEPSRFPGFTGKV